MTMIRRLSLAALGVAVLHVVFGAIVRISGSGMGCGDNWPKCYGYWFPPMSRPDLVVEVSHRYLASLLIISVFSLAFAVFINRTKPGVRGPGGVARTAYGALAAVFGAAILGGITVKLGNTPYATVAHWLMAMTLLALLAATAIRAGALGGASARVQKGNPKTWRAARMAAVMAIVAVAMGGVTAKVTGANVGCLSFPMCGANAGVSSSAVNVQLVHRIVAYLLFLHVFGMVMAMRKRAESAVVRRAVLVAFGFLVMQVLVAGAMIGMKLPPVLRSLHEAVGVGIWISAFVAAYLALISVGVGSGAGAPGPVYADDADLNGDDAELPDHGSVRRGSSDVAGASASALMEAPVLLGTHDEAVAEGDATVSVFEPTGLPAYRPLEQREDATATATAVPSPTLRMTPGEEPVLLGTHDEAVAEGDATVSLLEPAGPRASGPAAPSEPVVAAPTPQVRHSMAVLIARGADF
ncbi:MAG: cytochrome oxidase assembly family protein [Gemmatimonadetes bacterium]|nr:cytochrome oxidase assembly family protein [Gemmatimonadota bacterium]